MTQAQKQQLAKKLNGFLADNTSLNWLGNFNMEFKKKQFSIFFNKKSMAEKALTQLNTFNAKIYKTPKFVNIYFKYSVTILLD